VYIPPLLNSHKVIPVAKTEQKICGAGSGPSLDAAVASTKYEPGHTKLVCKSD
jgi:hypothetical protein